MKTGDRLGIGDIQAIKSFIPFGNAWAKNKQIFFSSGYLQNNGSRAMLFWCQRTLNFQCRLILGPFLPICLSRIFFLLKWPFFSGICFPGNKNHKSIDKKNEQHVWCTINNSRVGWFKDVRFPSASEFQTYCIWGGEENGGVSFD